MNYGEIKYTDIANGEGVRVSLFVSGCRNHCKGCFNPETWDFSYGREYTEQTKNEILDAVNKEYISGITILGGDPFEPENVPCVKELCFELKKRFPSKTIWIYSGYTFGYLWNRGSSDVQDILSHADVLVDGKFIEDQKDISLRFKGSKNQRIIDLPKTIKRGEVCLYMD